MQTLVVLSSRFAPGAAVSSGTECGNSALASCHMSDQYISSQPSLAGRAQQAMNQPEKMQRQTLTALNRRCLMKTNHSLAAILRAILFTLSRAATVKGTVGWALARGSALPSMLGARMWSSVCSFLRKQ